MVFGVFLNRTWWKTDQTLAIWTFQQLLNACVLRAVQSCAPSSWKSSRLSSVHRRRITSPSAQCQMQITEADSAALILPHPRLLSPFIRCSSQITLRQRAPAQQRAPRQCAQNCNCKSNVSHHAARTARYITARNLSMNTSMRQRLWISGYTGSLWNSRVTERFNRSQLHSASPERALWIARRLWL